MAKDKTIIRTRKNRENPYVMVDKYCINDNRLSWKAKGILVYLLSKPDDWSIMLSDLIKHAIDGRDSVKAGLRELEACGYLVRYQLRDENGKFGVLEFIVSERPQTFDIQDILPETENPSAVKVTGNGKSVNGKSVNGKTADGKSTTTNNDLTNNKLNNKNDDDELNNKTRDHKKNTLSFFQKEIIAECQERNVPDEEVNELLQALGNIEFTMRALDNTFDKVMDKYERGEVSAFGKYFVQVLKREQRRLAYVDLQQAKREQATTQYEEFPFYNWLEDLDD